MFQRLHHVSYDYNLEYFLYLFISVSILHCTGLRLSTLNKEYMMMMMMMMMIVCLSVCLSVRLSQVGVVQRWLNIGSDNNAVG